jgi:RNA polymerase sigma-70 factor (ECF subfamily)
MTFFAENRELLERFRLGDRAVLEMVYHHYVRPLSHILRQGFSVPSAERVLHVPGLSSPSDIESACQEVFLRAFRPAGRQGYDGERNYGNYLFRIARNWRIDEFRRRELPTVDVSVDELGVVDPELPVEDRMVDAELEGLIARYLDSVPERDRDYFKFRYVDGMAQTDAAGRLGLTRIQGRRIEARVKAGLIDYLKDRGYGGDR